MLHHGSACNGRQWCRKQHETFGLCREQAAVEKLRRVPKGSRHICVPSAGVCEIDGCSWSQCGPDGVPWLLANYNMPNDIAQLRLIDLNTGRSSVLLTLGCHPFVPDEDESDDEEASGDDAEDEEGAQGDPDDTRDGPAEAPAEQGLADGHQPVLAMHDASPFRPIQLPMILTRTVMGL